MPEKAPTPEQRLSALITRHRAELAEAVQAVERDQRERRREAESAVREDAGPAVVALVDALRARISADVGAGRVSVIPTGVPVEVAIALADAESRAPGIRPIVVYTPRATATGWRDPVGRVVAVIAVDDVVLGG